MGYRQTYGKKEKMAKRTEENLYKLAKYKIPRPEAAETGTKEMYGRKANGGQQDKEIGENSKTRQESGTLIAYPVEKSYFPCTDSWQSPLNEQCLTRNLIAGECCFNALSLSGALFIVRHSVTSVTAEAVTPTMEFALIIHSQSPGIRQDYNSDSIKVEGRVSGNSFVFVIFLITSYFIPAVFVFDVTVIRS